MAATLTVIWWRDIPAQVIAKDRRQSHKIVLHPRFQVAIDRAATKAGLKAFDVYIEQWRKVQRACGDDLEAEARVEAERLEAEYTRQRLNALVASGGLARASGPAADAADAAADARADGARGADAAGARGADSATGGTASIELE
jgi:Virulence factor